MSLEKCAVGVAPTRRVFAAVLTNEADSKNSALA